MKRVLLSLFVVAGVLYAAHAFFSANDGEPSGGPPAANGAVPNDAAPAKIDGGAAPETSLSVEAMSPSPAGSHHAIVVEQNPSPSPTETSPARSAATSSLAASGDASTDAKPDQARFMKVTSPASIREGPSTSAAIVGVAQPGAEAQVLARSTDWVEIIDPRSKKTGWIHESFLTPQAEPASRPVPPEEVDAALAVPEGADTADDEKPSLTSKPRKHASRHRHHRHTIVLGPFILRYR